MKKIISFIKQRIDWTLIAIGSFMAIYGFFGFEPTARIHSPGYHYEQDVRVIIALETEII